jgi:hypothetical protein
LIIVKRYYKKGHFFVKLALIKSDGESSTEESVKLV